MFSFNGINHFATFGAVTDGILYTMEGILKAICVGKRTAETTLFGRFVDLKENLATEEMAFLENRFC